MASDDLQKKLSQYYKEQSARTRISKVKLLKWLDRGEKFLKAIPPPATTLDSSMENLFAEVESRAGFDVLDRSATDKILSATGFKPDRLERLKEIEENIENCYLPEDIDIIVRLVTFLRVPVSKIQKHVEEKMKYASKALSLAPSETMLSPSKGVINDTKRIRRTRLKNVLSQHFWDKVRTQVESSIVPKDYYLLD